MRDGNSAIRAAAVAVELIEQGVSGFDLAGQEAGNPLSRHGAAIALAKDAGLGITLHAGEAEHAWSVKEALDLGADRIGHGVTALEDGAVLSRLADLGTVLEVCVSSNVQTGASRSVTEHQIEALRAAGVRCVLQVDNRTVSATSLNQEYELVAKAFQWGSKEFERMYLDSCQATFLSSQERSGLSRRGVL
jgi:adenosine deaminase